MTLPRDGIYPDDDEECDIIWTEPAPPPRPEQTEIDAVLYDEPNISPAQRRAIMEGK